MRYPIVLLCLGSACASSNNDVAITYDPCTPLAVVPIAPDQPLGPSEVSGIEDAIELWSHVLPVAIEATSDPGDRPVLPIRFEPGDTFFRAIYWDQTGQIWVGEDRLQASDYPLAIAHELGHAFGLLHVDKDERPSVMNVSNLDIPPTEEDARMVREMWASCAP